MLYTGCTVLQTPRWTQIGLLECSFRRMSITRRSRIFCQGGSRPDSQKTAWTTVFFVCFFSPQLILQLVLYQRKLYFPKNPEGVKHFPGGRGGWITRRSRIFCKGGSRPDSQKQPGQRCFLCVFLVLNLFYSWFYIRENYTFPRSRGGQTFSNEFQLYT